MAGVSRMLAAQDPFLSDMKLDSLSSRMHRFATLTFSGLSHLEAYRIAYEKTAEQEGTVKAHASELANHPAVLSKVRELRGKVEQQSTLSANLSRDFVLNGLMRLATAAEKETVQLGALQTLGKTVGIDLFREIHVTEQRTRTVEDVEQELKAKLDTLRAGLTIEGKAERVASDKAGQPGAGKDRRRKPKTT
jgi:hypothetical protein